MGGIKNKLTSKVKTLSSSLSLTERADERSSSGEVKTNNKSKSSGFCHLIRQTSSATFPVKGKELGSPWVRGAVSRRLTEGSLSAGLSLTILTKYLGIACLSLAILSTLILNIVSSYSYGKVNSNAEPVSNSSTSTLANNNDSSTCDPNNTNAESCISLSITSSSSSSTGGNDANLSLSIPQGGGLVAGRHTVSVSSNNVTGYDLYLTSKTDNTDMVNIDNKDAYIKSMHSTNDTAYGYYGGDYISIHSNEYGVAMGRDCSHGSLYRGDQYYESLINTPSKPNSNSEIYAFSGLSKKSNMMDSQISGYNPGFGKPTCTVYYGVWIDSPSTVLAGNYAVDVEYTAIAKEVPTPTINTLNQNSYELGSGTNLDSNNRLPVTITGDNLESTYKVYLESNADSSKQYDLTNNVTSVTITHLKLTLPTDITNSDLEPGDYTIHVVTQGGEASIGFTYTEKKALSAYDSVDNVRVDYDENMIPIYYTGNSSTPRWTSLNSMQIEQNTTTWFDYSGSRSNGEVKWANAVTVKDPSKYKDKSLVVDEADILGYWVYIPRYAYMVMRRDATDKVVTDEEAAAMGGFNIRFETVDDLKKTPAACPYSSSSTYYYDCVPQSYPGNNESLIDRSAWATHPAFTWQYTKDINGFDQTVELNGFWIGKFEATGSTQGPTILPNRKHMSRGYSGNIGDLYDIAKSMGIEDPNNKYGNTTSTDQSNQNNNNLAISTSHMLKNSEWGAVAYLASSKYGAGINNVQMNTQYQQGGDDNGDSSYGITGCGPTGSGITDIYTGTGTLGTNTACSINDISRSYNGSRGVLASTTNNVYGVYDMNGGAYEYVMGSYTTNAHQSSISQFANAARPPYVDLYYSANGFPSTDPLTGNDYCTWETCGGQALHETRITQSVMSPYQAWNQRDKGYSYFVYPPATWFLRGGYADDGSFAGIFTSNNIDSVRDFGSVGFRVALIAN